MILTRAQGLERSTFTRQVSDEAGLGDGAGGGRGGGSGKGSPCRCGDGVGFECLGMERGLWRGYWAHGLGTNHDCTGERLIGFGFGFRLQHIEFGSKFGFSSSLSLFSLSRDRARERVCWR